MKIPLPETIILYHSTEYIKGYEIIEMKNNE